MNIACREVRKSDYPFLTQLTGIPVTQWFDWDRTSFLAVALLGGQIIGVFAVGIGSEDNELVVLHMETMRYYRRMRVMRHLWTFAVGALIPFDWRANVGEEYLEAQCTLRSLGFRCTSKNEDGSLCFVRN